MTLMKLALPILRSFHAFTELIGRNNVILFPYRSADQMFFERLWVKCRMRY